MGPEATKCSRASSAPSPQTAVGIPPEQLAPSDLGRVVWQTVWPRSWHRTGFGRPNGLQPLHRLLPRIDPRSGIYCTLSGRHRPHGGIRPGLDLAAQAERCLKPAPIQCCTHRQAPGDVLASRPPPPSFVRLPIALCHRRVLHGEARCMVVNDWRTDRLLIGDGSLLGFEI